MPSSVVQKAGELAPDVRQAVESLLGRPLHPEEHVSLMVFFPHRAPTGPERMKVAQHLKDRIDKMADKLKDVPEPELDELIDEAVDHVRHNPS